MRAPTIFHSGAEFAIGAGVPVERTVVTEDRTGDVSIRDSSERVSIPLPLHRRAPVERYDYQNHLVRNADIVAAWTVAIGVFLLLMVMA